MKLLLHIAHPISEEARSWINQPNGFFSVDADNWLDCTALIKDFRRTHLSEFYWMVCECIALDLLFDKYKLID
jgi:hypothetical protein